MRIFALGSLKLDLLRTIFHMVSDNVGALRGRNCRPRAFFNDVMPFCTHCHKGQIVASVSDDPTALSFPSSKARETGVVELISGSIEPIHRSTAPIAQPYTKAKRWLNSTMLYAASATHKGQNFFLTQGGNGAGVACLRPGVSIGGEESELELLVDDENARVPQRRPEGGKEVASDASSQRFDTAEASFDCSTGTGLYFTQNPYG